MPGWSPFWTAREGESKSGQGKSKRSSPCDKSPHSVGGKEKHNGSSRICRTAPGLHPNRLRLQGRPTPRGAWPGGGGAQKPSLLVAMPPADQAGGATGLDDPLDENIFSLPLSSSKRAAPRWSGFKLEPAPPRRLLFGRRQGQMGARRCPDRWDHLDRSPPPRLVGGWHCYEQSKSKSKSAQVFCVGALRQC